MTLYVLLILIVSALATLGMVASSRYERQGRYAAPMGVGLALLVNLLGVWSGRGAADAADGEIEWPPFMKWWGEPVYGSDALAVGLGAWCLLLGALGLWIGAESRNTPVWKLAVGTLAMTILYSLAYTWDLRFFAVQVLLLAMLAWTLMDDGRWTMGHSLLATRYSLLLAPVFSLGLGAIALMAAVLLIGRATGGEYSVAGLAVPALAGWPLGLLALFVVLWAGSVPFTGWSVWGYSGVMAALMQTLVIGVPIVVLVLRLEGTIATQVIGAAPESWAAFMGALTWIGGLTALAASAGMAATAGTDRWQSFLTAHAMGLVVWGLGLDTALGHYAALAILFAYGAARITLELAVGAKSTSHPVLNPRVATAIAAASLGAAPLTVGFVGVWLLAAALLGAESASAAMWLAGAAIVAACGTALHFARAERRVISNSNPKGDLRLAASFAGCAVLLIGGIAPGLWLPMLAPIAGVQAGFEPVSPIWSGIEASGISMALPTVPIAVGALALVGIAWLVRRWAMRGVKQTTVLLPTAHKRLGKYAHDNRSKPDNHSLPRPTPTPLPVWWLSLLWLEDWLRRLGTRLFAWSARAGSALGYLEGQYYLPVALALTLVAVLALTR